MEQVRELTHEKAVELYMLDHMHLDVFNKPTEKGANGGILWEGEENHFKADRS